MKTMKTLAGVSAAFFSATSIAHTGVDIAIDEAALNALASGFNHPFTGVDHILALGLLGGAIALLHAGNRRILKRWLSGAALLCVLLSWSFLHYSGEYFAAYATGFAITSTLLMAAGVFIASIGKRFKGAFSRS